MRTKTGPDGLRQWFCLGLAIAVLSATCARGQMPAANTSEQPSFTEPNLWEGVPEGARTHGQWSFAFGVGWIADTTVNDYPGLAFKRLEGPGEGLTYNLTASYRLHEFDWRLKWIRLQPAIEVPFMLTLVDQKTGGLTPDVNLGLVLRWRDFPWNRYLYTTLSAGAGLSYSFDVWTGDYQRHPGEDRSRLKFWLPIEATFALPRYPQHQLMFFIDHQSGGQILDKGGIDAWGFGYRFLY